MLFSAASAALLLSTPAFGQILNQWRQRVFNGCCATQEHPAELAFDGDTETFAQAVSVPNQLSLLFNSKASYSGLYIQSSGNYITDYHVRGLDYERGLYTIGRVTNANSNFTVINFFNALGEPQMFSDVFFLYIDGIRGNTTSNSTYNLNEIYPIYPGDEIYYPPGQSAQPSPTQDPVETPTPTPSPTWPRPSAPGLILNKWPVSGPTSPIPIGGSDRSALVDDEVNTGSKTELIGNLGYPLHYSLLFNGVNKYAGLYILSTSPALLTDYRVTAQNMKTYNSVDVCKISGATSNFTACLFTNEDGQPFYDTYTIVIYPEAVVGGGNEVEIKEIWPIWVGDTIAEL